MDTQRNAVAVAANESFAVTAQRAAHPLLRRLLVLATFGLGFWLLTCMAHSASASADTAHPAPVSHSHQHPDPLGGLRAVALRHVPALTQVGIQPVKAVEHLTTHIQRDLHGNVQRLTHDTAHAITRSMDAVRAMTHQATDRLATTQRALHLTTSNSASSRQRDVSAAHQHAVRTSHRSGRAVERTARTPEAASARPAPSTRSHHHAAVAAGHVHRVLGATPSAPRPDVPAAPGGGGAPPTTGSVSTQLAAALTPTAQAVPGEQRSRHSRTHSRLLGIAAGKPTFSPD